MTRTDRRRILDLCGGEGGAAKGYADAGFEVVGVDIKPQPRYPYEFIQADALEVLRDRTFVDTFDAIHGSWPCQAYSPLNALPTTKAAAEHPDLVGPGRALMATYDMPWVIENVMAAPLDRLRSIVLCGEMFGLRTIRHRRFEPSPGLTLVAPRHPTAGEIVDGVRCDKQGHRRRTATKQRRQRWAEGWHVSITGDVGTYVGPEAMGIDWMTGDGLSEAIPPAYTSFIGMQLANVLTTGAVAPPPTQGDLFPLADLIA
jgi:DNA (cytosine-5)-methyltransferase 1